MNGPLHIAVAGLGTVGAGTLELLQTHGERLRQRCGRPIVVVAVSARDKGRDRGIDLDGMEWHDDAVAMAARSGAEVVVELIGGADGVAKAVCEAAIAGGKHVVTANKALLAHHGTALARAAEAKGVSLGFEAAVAGGVPIIKALREGLAANGLTRIYGILNGTCNYILTAMRESGANFEAVLADAQALGYAEADPSLDIDGIDAAHKLAILTSVAFGCEINFPAVYIEGIRDISSLDIQFAGELGYEIKLLGIARLTGSGVEQRVHPCLVPLAAPIAHVEGVFNAVVAEGDFVGTTVYEGRGAGAGPTASAVVADLVDIARGHRVPTFSVPATALAKIPAQPMERHRGAYYIRLMVVDQPGVIADVTATFRDEKISLESMLQRGRAPGETVPVILITHDTEESAMSRALEKIAILEAVADPPRMIRIEGF
ncbi:MAG: homoserine dehydrogenase [Proteobacteria bacterium]|nr:homoserine dehydrogenase [Pseudomonadota bacterium]